MKYLLDSDTLSELYETTAPGHQTISRRFSDLQGSTVLVVSIVALYELEYAYANAPPEMKPLLRQRIEAAQSSFEVLALTPAAATLFGKLKVDLRMARGLSERGSRVHNIDLMVAATAVTENCTLVSGDSLYVELQRLQPLLRVENWFA